MQVFEYFCKKTLELKFVNKFYLNSSKKLWNFKRLTLSFKNKNLSLKTIATHLLFIELLSNKKGHFVKSKRHNLVLKIKVGNPVGCKLVLSKKRMFKFFKKITQSLFMFRGSNFSKQIVFENSFCFFLSLSDLIRRFNFKILYNLFNKLEKLHVSFVLSKKIS